MSIELVKDSHDIENEKSSRSTTSLPSIYNFITTVEKPLQLIINQNLFRLSLNPSITRIDIECLFNEHLNDLITIVRNLIIYTKFDHHNEDDIISIPIIFANLKEAAYEQLNYILRYIEVDFNYYKISPLLKALSKFRFHSGYIYFSSINFHKNTKYNENIIQYPKSMEVIDKIGNYIFVLFLEERGIPNISLMNWLYIDKDLNNELAKKINKEPYNLHKHEYILLKQEVQSRFLNVEQIQDKYHRLLNEFMVGTDDDYFEFFKSKKSPELIKNWTIFNKKRDKFYPKLCKTKLNVLYLYYKKKIHYPITVIVNFNMISIILLNNKIILRFNYLLKKRKLNYILGKSRNNLSIMMISWLIEFIHEYYSLSTIE